MKKKYLYMLFLLIIFLGGFVLKPTLAKFTSNYTTDEDVVGLSFDFNIGISNIEEYEEINVGAGEVFKFNVEVSNNSSNTVYYGVWYKLINPSELPDDVTIARLEGTETTTSGSIDSNDTKTVTVIIINDSDDTLKINLGVVSSTTSTEDIEYLDGRKLISGTASTSLELKLGDYVSLTPTVSSYTTDTTYTGYSSTQTINPQELDLWRVISLNDDGTVDIISEHVSSTAVYFSRSTGYENLVGYLNVLASQYENSTYTVGSRYFGYNGQTEYITELFVKQFEVPWTCSTSYDGCDAEESRGGGDTLYLDDYNLVNTVLGTERATNLSGGDTGYWIASRYYEYDSSTDASWSGRSVVTWTSVGDNPRSSSLFYRESSGHMDTSASNALRPILTLKSGLNYSGSGTENDHGVPMAG